MMLAFDPGVRACGWALFESADAVLDLKTGGVIRPSGSLTILWEMLCAQIPDRHKITKVVIEEPAYFIGSLVGQASAESGSLVKLAQASGLLAGFSLWCQSPFEMISVQRWKGNLSKELVKERITAFMMKQGTIPRSIKGDAWDAVGLGLYAKGLLFQ